MMNIMKNRPAIYPLILCLCPVLFLYARNIEETAFSEILLPSAVMLVFTLVLLISLNLFLRNPEKSALIVAIFLVWFYSYGHVRVVLESWKIDLLTAHDRLFVLWAILFIGVGLFALKTRRDLTNITRIFTVVIISLMAFCILNITVYQIKTSYPLRNISVRMADADADTGERKDKTGLRDIYYIILDGYAGSWALKEIYGFDNHDFTDYLEKKGFYVASESRSNYGVTFLSLASSLNMEYINYLCTDETKYSKDRSKAYEMIRDNKVVSFLRQKGYMYVHFGSGWAATESNNYADLNIRGGWYSEYMMVLIKTTVLDYFSEYLAERNSRMLILKTFTGIFNIHKIKGPKFIFAHITCPHPPYLFQEDGRMVKKVTLEMDGSEWLKRERYLGQLKYINKLTREMVDNILARSETEPIIILQADHGSASLGRPHPPLNLADDQIKNTLMERMGILNAYYLPGGGSKALYTSITPVNSFRSIFNFYFGGDFPLLEDRNYYGDYDTPYVLTDVTDIVGLN